jgi:glucuronosyltransferase
LVKDKSVKVLEYGEHLGDLEARIYGNSRIVDSFWENRRELGLLKIFTMKKGPPISHDVLSDKTFIDNIKNIKPDLIVIDSMPFNVNMVVLPYMLDIPYAFIGHIHDVVLSKVPFSPGLTPFPIQVISDKMSFLERLKSTLMYLARMNFELFYDSSSVTKFAPHKPYKSISELAANGEVFIAEVDHILDYPRVTLPNTKLIGGSSASPAKPLEGEFKNFVDQSKNGIIVFTFGGSVVNIPPHISSKFLAAFKQLDLGVIWKVNITSPDPTRILTSKWIPQNDLLGHEKTKLFISHCGKNGQYEALYHGVPILCLPIYGDQPYNSERIKIKELGLGADMRITSADELATMMKQIVYDGKYSENMKKASRLYRELYKNPRKEAAYWLDHVLQYGGAYMRSPGQLMPWYQIYVLDVLAAIIFIAILIILIVFFVLKKCYRLFKGSNLARKPKTE